MILISWNVAIKTMRRHDCQLKKSSTKKKHGKITAPYTDELPLLLDEAKTMWSVGSYHENIVNLQGITAREEDGILCQVRSL